MRLFENTPLKVKQYKHKANRGKKKKKSTLFQLIIIAELQDRMDSHSVYFFGGVWKNPCTECCLDL